MCLRVLGFIKLNACVALFGIAAADLWLSALYLDLIGATLVP